MSHIAALVLTGASGVGKTAVADLLSDLLIAEVVPNAVIDMDGLRWAYPRPTDDPFNARLGLQNLKAIWPNYVAFGVQRVIFPYVFESREEIEGLRQAVHCTSWLAVRLTAATAVLHARLAKRESGASLARHCARAEELHELFQTHEVADYTVATDTKTTDSVADAVLQIWNEWLEKNPATQSTATREARRGSLSLPGRGLG